MRIESRAVRGGGVRAIGSRVVVAGAEREVVKGPAADAPAMEWSGAARLASNGAPSAAFEAPSDTL